MNAKNILFATSEVHPLIKTGGLADVSGSLPIAIKTMRKDIRIVMPAYQSVLSKVHDIKTVSHLHIPSTDSHITILETLLPGSSVKVWLIDSPECFDRAGSPYADENGKEWDDNARRFTIFSRAITALALNKAGLDWQPDIVHCNDWQTGLVPALLAQELERPATIFTIHNLAYQGLFSRDIFNHLGLPPSFFDHNSMEFYEKISFIKGGIIYADEINTVSPRYAQEICTPEFGAGLDGLLNVRKDHLTGILNGTDYTQWNPARDPYLHQTYNAHSLDKKLDNKMAIQRHFNLPVDPNIPLIGMIGRLETQKGIDFFLDALPSLTGEALQFVILGSGDKTLENRLLSAQQNMPDQLAIHIGYSEAIAHQIEGSTDIFLMPSRFEPCGLNQLYSLRYGTVPIVRETGGLADTVINATPESILNTTATGITFQEPSASALLDAISHALALYKEPKLWKKLVFNGMQKDHSWRRSAKNYLDLYQQAQQTRTQA